MVLGRKTNFFLEKDGFGQKNQFFLRKKMVLGRKNQLFPRENQKNHLFGVWPHSFPKDVFFGFLVFPRKKLVFLPKTIFFPRKKLVFLSKTIFFLGKSWFSCPKPSFS